MATSLPPAGPPGAGAGHGYPVTLLLDGHRCVVVGGGRVGAGKAAGLLAAGALVQVVAPRIDPAIRELPVRLAERPFQPSDLEGARLVVTATGIPAVDAAVHEAAERAGVLVNAADAPASCTVVLPAVLRRGPVSLAVSTGGRSPALAGLLRDRLAAAVPPGVDAVAEVLGGTRDALHAAGRTTAGLPWRSLAEELLARAAAGEAGEALRAEAARWLASAGEVAP